MRVQFVLRLLSIFAVAVFLSGCPKYKKTQGHSAAGMPPSNLPPSKPPTRDSETQTDPEEMEEENLGLDSSSTQADFEERALTLWKKPRWTTVHVSGEGTQFFLRLSPAQLMWMQEASMHLLTRYWQNQRDLSRLKAYLSWVDRPLHKNPNRYALVVAGGESGLLLPTPQVDQSMSDWFQENRFALFALGLSAWVALQTSQQMYCDLCMGESSEYSGDGDPLRYLNYGETLADGGVPLVELGSLILENMSKKLWANMSKALVPVLLPAVSVDLMNFYPGTCPKNDSVQNDMGVSIPVQESLETFTFKEPEPAKGFFGNFQYLWGKCRKDAQSGLEKTLGYFRTNTRK